MSLYTINDSTVGSQLGSNYTAASGSIVLKTGQGANFPTAGRITLVKNAAYHTASDTGAPSVNCSSFTYTGVSTDTLTGVAVMSGFSDQNFSTNDYAEQRFMAEYIDDLNTQVTTLNSSVTTINGSITTLNSEVSTLQGYFSGGVLGVADGGTGDSSATAYAVLCGGTTSTGAFQSIASVGTTGQVLTSNGAGALPTFQTVASNNAFYFGSGKDGSPSLPASTTLTRDMYYQNLTIPASTVIKPNGFRIFVAGTLDITNASAGSIVYNGTVGSNAAGASGGSGGATGVGTNASFAAPAGGSITGGNGSTTNGAAGGGPNAGASFNLQFASQGGAGGAGGTGTGGTTGSAAASTQASFPYRYVVDFKSPVSISSGQSGSGGGGGGGDNTNSGGGGGGGAGPGGCIWISAATIARGTNSTASIIQAKGGNGGNGANGVAGNSGGGGGAGGGQGGTIIIYYGAVTGSTITNAIDVTGGTGGNGGTLSGTGSANGTGGGGGPGGYILVTNLTATTLTETIGASRVAPPSAGTMAGNSATASQANI